MSKKRSKDEWVNFVRAIFKRKRADREYSLPKDYLQSVSDSLWRTNPTKEIIYNTLSDVAKVMFEKGFQRKEDDIAFFKAKQKQHLDKSFKQFMDDLDDRIHIKSNQPKQ